MANLSPDPYGSTPYGYKGSFYFLLWIFKLNFDVAYFHLLAGLKYKHLYLGSSSEYSSPNQFKNGVTYCVSMVILSHILRNRTQNRDDFIPLATYP